MSPQDHCQEPERNRPDMACPGLWLTEPFGSGEIAREGWAPNGAIVLADTPT
jgi:hypothetical protein